MEQRIYLDNAATTPMLQEVIDEVMESFADNFGNPSSLHRLGLESQRKIKEARTRVAHLMGTPSEDIIFTSGGTESNNLTILGVARARKRYGNHCITTGIEHSSVLNAFRFLEDEGWEITYMPVDNYGNIDLEQLKKEIRADTVLISIAHVNSEIGSIQPIGELGLFLKANYPDIVFHTDAVQSFGRLAVKPMEWGVDLMSISGHKVHAPKGIGALYIRKGIHLIPLQWGGGQEMGLRSGTENIPGIVGLGKASLWLSKAMSGNSPHIMKMKRKLAHGIIGVIPETVINGPTCNDGAPHILNIGIPGIRGETLLHVLESYGVYVSTGSACSSRKTKISHVLESIGASTEIAQGAIRFSLSNLNSEDEMIMVPDILKKSVDQVRRFTRR